MKFLTKQKDTSDEFEKKVYIEKLLRYIYPVELYMKWKLYTFNNKLSVHTTSKLKGLLVEGKGSTFSECLDQMIEKLEQEVRDKISKDRKEIAEIEAKIARA